MLLAGSQVSAMASDYVRRDAKNAGVIVFVHGLTGDASSTWTNATTKAFWPALIAADPAPSQCAGVAVSAAQEFDISEKLE